MKNFILRVRVRFKAYSGAAIALSGLFATAFAKAAAFRVRKIYDHSPAIFPVPNKSFIRKTGREQNFAGTAVSRGLSIKRIL
ncbi:hypothetical protein ACFOTA_03640 [Chitinophaga sp. GCM10012297]|uniref:Uncharacterized protein n=1 Tax=Chitinophaga chungangae TaxID=2821488 RepID=A0ABS3Y9W7_9BACT|nr:hypothetical protein [Chitinophaga chungangae]MBO9151285.1 hypothetical protein [Chitinophaga chungangae]